MFDLAVQWLIVAVDVSVKVVVLAAIAWLSLRLLKIQDNNLSHRTWTGVLVGMLLLPVLSQTLPALRLPVAVPGNWRIDRRQGVSPLADSVNTRAAIPIEAEISQQPSSPFAEGASSGQPRRIRSNRSDDAWSTPSAAGPEPQLGISNLSPEAIDRRNRTVVELDRRDTEAAPSTSWLQAEDPGPPIWPASLLALWLAGAGVMALRLLAGVAYLLRLVWSSTAITSSDLAEKGVSLPWLPSDKRPATTCQSPLIRVPMAVGVIRPRILLPCDWNAWSADKLQAVMAHEQTHIQRADCAVFLLAELNRCLYWFHPVAWWLRSQLGQLAETVCDDAVIDGTCGRAAYARHLLDVASTVSHHRGATHNRGRLIPVGVSMARRSNVETRIHAILDLTRPLSNRLSWTTSLLLLGVLIPVITLAAAVQPTKGPDAHFSAEHSATDHPSAADKVADPAHIDDPAAIRNESLVTEDRQGSEEDSADATRKESVELASLANDSTVEKRELSTEPRSYSGRVETPAGEPIAGAKIWLAVATQPYRLLANRDNREGLLRELGTTDAQGRFEIVLDAETTEEIRQLQEIRKRFNFYQTQLVATAQGRGLSSMPLDVFDDHPAPSAMRATLRARLDKSLGEGRFASRILKLRPESQPVRGQLVDLAGNPLPNVTVLVENLQQPDMPRLLKAFEMSWKRELNEAFSTSFGVGGLARSELQKLIPPVTTDENGQFELRGIGDDQMVTLVFKADRVEARPVHVLGREMETVNVPYNSQRPSGSKDVYVGRDFAYAVGPSVPVEGVVTDIDTGQPVAGVLVYVDRLFQEEYERERLDTTHMRAVTDRQGRFRIIGMPPGEGHVLQAMPRKSEPYLETSQDISLSLEDGDAKQIEFQMKRGIWIEGRITDNQTGEPLSATVGYLPMENNPHAVESSGLDWSWIRDRFWTDIDGQYRTVGLPGPGVLLVTMQDPGYPQGAGAETIDGYDPSGGYVPTIWPQQVSNWHLLRQIAPAADTTSSTCDLVLDAKVSIPGRVVGPRGKPVSDFYVLGQSEGDEWWRPRHTDYVRTTDRFTVYGYDGKTPRQLFFKSQDESLVGRYRLKADAPEEIMITLEPSVRVTGRVIASRTDLPAARCFLHCEKSSLYSDDSPTVKFRTHWCFTDDEGRFELKGLTAGLAYEMVAQSDSVPTDRDRFTIDLTGAKPGDAIELGDVTGPDSEGDSKK